MTGLGLQIASGRANGDAYSDVVVSVGNIPAVMLGTSTGVLSAPSFPQPGCGGAVGCQMQHLALADVTADGVDDIIASVIQMNPGNNDWTAVRVLRGIGNATYFASLETTIPSSVIGLGRISVGDLSGSGAPDLVFGRQWYTGSESAVVLLTGAGNGTFSTSATFNAFGTAAPLGSTVADLDGDGTVEAVVSMGGMPTTILRRGAMGLTVAGTLPFQAQGLTTADVNGDGRRDVLGVNGSLVIAINAGNLTFLAPLVIAGADTDLAVRDWNGDGALDVVASRGSSLVFFVGDGSGAFAAGPQFGQSAGRIAIGDYNGDGKTDIATLASGVVHVYLAK